MQIPSQPRGAVAVALLLCALAGPASAQGLGVFQAAPPARSAHASRVSRSPHKSRTHRSRQVKSRGQKQRVSKPKQHGKQETARLSRRDRNAASAIAQPERMTRRERKAAAAALAQAERASRRERKAAALGQPSRPGKRERKATHLAVLAAAPAPLPEAAKPPPPRGQDDEGVADLVEAKPRHLPTQR